MLDTVPADWVYYEEPGASITETTLKERDLWFYDIYHDFKQNIFKK